VVLSTDTPDQVRQQLQTVLVRNDVVPVGEVVTALLPMTDTVSLKVPTLDTPGRALLIIGSPKVKSPSTSGVLGDYVLQHLQQQGWETESLLLRRTLLQGEGKAELLRAIDRADLLLVAFPLYLDSLPFLMMKLLEGMAAHLSSHPQNSPKRLFAIANNGFPEAHHNALALAICRQFARDTGMIWLGGLALGAGEALFAGLPMSGPQRAGRPPVQHVI
jgi:hypothetical protein